MNTATIVYIPPVAFKGTAQFIDNLQRCLPSGRLIVISDHGYKDIFPKAEHVVLSVSPEKLEANKVNPQCGISNAIFVVAMRTAKEKKLSHVLYLESDCRLAEPGFDQKVFDEFFALPFPVIAAGTLMTWNIFNGGTKWITRWQRLIKETTKSPAYPTPVHCYGIFPHEKEGEPRPCNPTIFPNGAGAVLSIAWMHQLFNGFTNMQDIATGAGLDGKAWDWQIGSRARQVYGHKVFELFAHLRTVCSCYGNLAMTTEERLALLRNKDVMISHQHKGKEAA